MNFLENIRFLTACSFKVKGQSLKNGKRNARRRKGEIRAGKERRENEQTGSNLITRNAPELGNEGLSFRLTLSGRRCYSFVCPERGTFLPFPAFLSIFMRLVYTGKLGDDSKSTATECEKLVEYMFNKYHS